MTGPWGLRATHCVTSSSSHHPCRTSTGWYIVAVWLYSRTEWDPWWQLICVRWILIKTTKLQTPWIHHSFTTWGWRGVGVQDFQSNPVISEYACSTCWRTALTGVRSSYRIHVPPKNSRRISHHLSSVTPAEIVSRWKDLRLPSTTHPARNHVTASLLAGWIDGRM